MTTIQTSKGKGTQWLLIGGVAHGETLWVKGGDSILYPDSNKDAAPYFSNIRYIGHRFFFNGHKYQIGCIDEKDIVLSEVCELITKTKLAPIDAIERCIHCDGAGEVHGVDGEWRGTCTECLKSESEVQQIEERVESWHQTYK